MLFETHKDAYNSQSVFCSVALFAFFVWPLWYIFSYKH